MVRPHKIMTVFGTRPEAIKVAPVIHELERRPRIFETINVSSGQHRELLLPFIHNFRLRLDHDLGVYRRNQQPDEVSRLVIRRLLPILGDRTPDLLLVQGDTSTAVGAATAGSSMRIPVGHIEAGLRSGDEMMPFPEEIYRKRIAALASYHFAPTVNNQRNLLLEGIPGSSIFVTGNTAIDSLRTVLANGRYSRRIQDLIRVTDGFRRIVLTMHRRENMRRLGDTFLALRRFVESHEDVCLIFPVHPNPSVGKAAAVLQHHARIRLLDPLEYQDFIWLLTHSWIVLTDSGGIQEETPSLGKTVLLFRARTERPEALGAGGVRIAGQSPEALMTALEELEQQPSKLVPVAKSGNPFGQGASAKTIVDIIESLIRTGEANEASKAYVWGASGGAIART